MRFISRWRRAPQEVEVADASRKITSFTAHNIRLDDGTETYPQAPYGLMNQNGIFLAVERMLRLIYQDDLAGKSIVDVGCLEGGYATEFARLGMVATGIEVRDSNYQNCLLVKRGTNLPNLHFVRDDAKSIGRHGPFDAVFVCGLLYHLDQPRKFLADAARVCKRAIFLETHVATDPAGPAVETYRLSGIEVNEGLKGRWFPEHEALPEDELDKMKWASWSNERSFWIQKEYLLQLLKDLGFDMVLEQFDCEPDIAEQHTTGWRRKTDRVLLVGIKSAG